MVLSILAIVVGLAVLVWSADRFVTGAAITARYVGLSPLVIGMVVIGFGTSAPEMTVSALSAYQGNTGIALGNAYGSNIANIALILGLTALISPIAVQSRVLRIELPVLMAVTLIAAWQVSDGVVSRIDALVLMIIFSFLVGWTLWQSRKTPDDALAVEVTQDLSAQSMSRGRAVFWLVVGLVVLIVSSRVLVWGAVGIASQLGLSDLVIGLTIVAIGTSLPELASSLLAARKGEHDLALGNILGSNLFNTLAVVGVAGLIRPLTAGPEVFSRDMMVLIAITLALFVVGFGWRRPGRINRWEGAALMAAFVAYTVWLISGN